MKITRSLSVLLGLLPFTQARLKSATTVLQQEAELSSELGKKKKKEMGWHKPITVNFKLEHFKADEDVGTSAFNKKLAMGAFNRAFEQVFEGMTSDWGFIDNLVEVPEPEDPDRLSTTRRNTRRIYYGTYSIDASCRLCPPDLLARGKKGGESFSKFLRDQKKWDEVANLFCLELKGTGIENYEDVDECFFRCGYYGENEVELMELAASEAVESSAEVLTDVSGSIQTIVSVHRLHPSAVLDVAVLEKAFAVAYNNVFEDRDYSVEGVQLLRQVTASESAVGQNIVRVHGNEIAISAYDEDEGDDDSEDNEDSSDDSDDVEFLTAMYWMNVNWTCKGKKCNANDMLPGVFLQNMPDTSRHSILESYFCHNLREYGDAAFAEAAGCDIMFQP